MKLTALLVLVIVGLLAFTNPGEAEYRAHIQEKRGIVGVLGMGLADLLAKDASKGIHRDNYFLFSRFYAGGDGILPRQDLAWGVASKFVDLKLEETK